MLYFKRIIISGCTSQHLEAALRKVSLKRTSPLDMASAISNIGTDKYFLGYQGKKSLTFTRIKASPEKLLPKLIIKLLPGNEKCGYRIRFSAVSMMFFFMFTLPWLLGVTLFISGNGDFINFLTITGVYSIYATVFLLELRLTMWRVKKAILNYGVATEQV